VQWEVDLDCSKTGKSFRSQKFANCILLFPRTDDGIKTENVCVCVCENLVRACVNNQTIPKIQDKRQQGCIGRPAAIVSGSGHGGARLPSAGNCPIFLYAKGPVSRAHTALRAPALLMLAVWFLACGGRCATRRAVECGRLASRH